MSQGVSCRTVKTDGLPFFIGKRDRRMPRRFSCCTDCPLLADVRASLRSAFGSLSLGRARLPGLRTQRLAGPEQIRVYVRPLRRDHESLHRSSRSLAVHALHAGLRRPRGFSQDLGPSGPDRGFHRPGRRSPQRRTGGELEAEAGLLCRSRRQRKRTWHKSRVAAYDADAPSRERSQRGTL